MTDKSEARESVWGSTVLAIDAPPSCRESVGFGETRLTQLSIDDPRYRDPGARDDPAAYLQTLWSTLLTAGRTHLAPRA